MLDMCAHTGCSVHSQQVLIPGPSGQAAIAAGAKRRHTHAVERVGLGTATSYVGATQRQVQRVWGCLDSTVLFCGCLGGGLY